MTDPTERWLRVEMFVDNSELQTDDLWEIGTLGIEIQDNETYMEGVSFPEVPEGRSKLIAFFPATTTPDQLKELILRTTAHSNPEEVVVAYFDDDSWKTAWKRFFKPVRLSRRVMVGPPWEKFDPPVEWLNPHSNQTEPVAQGIKLIINPGMAFGTGTHETTQLVASILDDLLADQLLVGDKGPLTQEHLPFDALLDVGCGSGILSMLAFKLGVSEVYGIDIDPDAINSANEILADNHIDQVSLSTTPLKLIEPRYPLVVANILGHIILREKFNLADVVAPEGWIVISGVLLTEADNFSDEFQEAGFAEIFRTHKNEWAAFIFSRNADS